jgi:hypothetical protein
MSKCWQLQLLRESKARWKHHAGLQSLERLCCTDANKPTYVQNLQSLYIKKNNLQTQPTSASKNRAMFDFPPEVSTLHLP